MAGQGKPKILFPVHLNKTPKVLKLFSPWWGITGLFCFPIGLGFGVFNYAMGLFLAAVIIRWLGEVIFGEAFVFILYRFAKYFPQPRSATMQSPYNRRWRA